MTTFLRFFILALTPLLGVTGTFGPALLYGVTATLAGLAVAVVVQQTRDKLKESALLWAVLGTGTFVVTLIDTVTSLWLPGLRAAWGIYLNLLPFLPLLALLPLERTRAEALPAELVRTLQSGLMLTFLLAVTGLARELAGAGTLTLIPAAEAVPAAGPAPLSVLLTGAGGFFLAAAAVVGYRAVRPRLGRLALATETWGTGRDPRQAEAPAVVPAPKAAPVPAAAEVPEPAEEWGEDLAAAVAALGSAGPDKRRLLVIGSGNGELAYYLAMLCLQQAQAAPDKSFAFRVRGVDHFSARVETAIRGIYRDHQIEFVPPAVRKAYMEKGDDKYLWKVGPEPRLHVQFEVADFQHGQVFFPQPAHLILLNQGIEYVTDDKKAALLKTVCTNLVAGGALVVTGAFRRELLPEGMKRTGTSVFRRS